MKLVKCIGLLCLLLTQSCSDNSSPFAPLPTVGEIRIGSGTGNSFVEGAIELGSSTITEGGSTSVTVNIVDGDNLPVGVTGNVTFSSSCLTTSDASFSSTSVAIATGTATTTYNDISCSTDTITATATLDSGETLVANGGLSIIPVTKIGSGSGTGFTEGVITLSATSIVPGGTSNISVNIVDANNTLVSSLQTITFSSTCSNQSLATFTPATNSSASGTVSTFYTDNGCIGKDFITATLSAGSTSIIATGSIDITPLQLGSGSGTSFNNGVVTLTPSSITEGETSTITVNVVDSNNAPYTTSATVDFSSTCSSASPATASFTNSTVSTINGVATTTYQDAGCPNDTITATLNTVSTLDPVATGPLDITALRIGTGSGGTFVNGDLALGLTSISPSGSTSTSVNVVDAAGQLITSPVTVTFDSNCVSQGIASFDNPTTSTINGVATVTYTAGTGCSGTDIISATINPFNNNVRTASRDLNIAAATVNSIQFTGTDRDIIALKGTGNSTGISENALLTFTVLDNTGAPASNATVDFTLNTTLGGITLQSATDTSGSDGLVQAVIQSGTVATSVRVTATISGSSPSLSTQSTAIVISTGLPDQNSFSLAAETLNPEAWNYQGVTVKLTARLSDRFNNPIHDGTNINFTTELGQIEPSCSTINGACSVTWSSSAPQSIPGFTNNFGRLTIMAHVEGEETFRDNDSDGVYSDGDGNLASNGFDDISEPFVDYNENGIRDNQEPFSDFDGDNAFDGPDGLFNGVACTHSTECSPRETTFVWGSLALILSETNPVIVKIEDTSVTLCDNTDVVTTNDCYDDGVSTTGTSYPSQIKAGSTSQTLTFSIVGATNRQVLPAGTTVNFTADNGEIVTGGTHTIANTNGDASIKLDVAKYSVTVRKDTDPNTDGSLIPSVTTPGNNAGAGTFTTTFPSIPIDDRPLFVTIDRPSTVTNYKTSTEFTLAGTAIDPEDGTISSNITWSSNIDGSLGTGASLTVNTAGAPLTVGDHTIIAQITDSNGNIEEATINITIDM